MRVFYDHLRGLPPGSLALDFGCGIGGWSVFLQKTFGFTIVGMDISKEAVKFAKENYSNENACFLVGDCQNPPFRKEVFDIIFSSDVLGHVPDVMQALKEMFTLLKKEGIASIYSESSFDSDFISRNLIKKLGFDPWSLDITFYHVSLYPLHRLLEMINSVGFIIKSYRSVFIFSYFITDPMAFHAGTKMLKKWDIMDKLNRVALFMVRLRPGRCLLFTLAYLEMKIFGKKSTGRGVFLKLTKE
jgi:ubiquinone/menaquinone biosynthesis C-methylase UbiE